MCLLWGCSVCFASKRWDQIEDSRPSFCTPEKRQPTHARLQVTSFSVWAPAEWQRLPGDSQIKETYTGLHARMHARKHRCTHRAPAALYIHPATVREARQCVAPSMLAVDQKQEVNVNTYEGLNYEQYKYIHVQGGVRTQAESEDGMPRSHTPRQAATLVARTNGRRRRSNIISKSIYIYIY